jgi:hypothetical protein
MPFLKGLLPFAFGLCLKAFGLFFATVVVFLLTFSFCRDADFFANVRLFAAMQTFYTIRLCL